MAWIVYGAVVLAISILIGVHLGRFRIAYTEMSGMMLGMTMGMLNGFLLGYAAAAFFSSMFWGNLVGVLLGLSLGVYYGRAGGLMGVMDGGMGGVMGGSMGAMLAVMVAFPQWAEGWTAVLLSVLYILAMAGLVALIEQSAPEHAALHRLLPVFTRVVAREAAEEAENARFFQAQNVRRKVVDYYAVFGVPRDASLQEISAAYLEKTADLKDMDEARAQRLERGLALLSDPRKRQAYDRRLQEMSGGELTGTLARPDCCPPPRSKKGSVTVAAGEDPARAKMQGSLAPSTVRQNAAVAVGSPSSRQFRSAPSAQTRALATGAYREQTIARQAATEVRRSEQPQPSRGNQTGNTRPQAREKRESPVSWVGGLAALAMLVAVCWWALSTGTIGFATGKGSGNAPDGKIGEIVSAPSSGGVGLALSVSPDPPRFGATTLTLRVKDSGGQPLEGAQVKWSMDMINMKMGISGGQMVDNGSGTYQAKAYFSMAGPWRIDVQVSKDGQTLKNVRFDLQVR